ncbi:MAG: hypothetical protein OIN84_10930 [Candidatus Methanoperedens sp.]|nr:hypothetical protein [Candidatus Methanoperedens sp. BLZ2]MCX9078477.1 hypothetical protein [Candidatus Methanoperedens sp.]
MRSNRREQREDITLSNVNKVETLAVIEEEIRRRRASNITPVMSA